MPESNTNTASAVLAHDEPPPYFVMHAESQRPVLLTCDHASCRIPASLEHLGLDPFARRCHLAIDIGAGPLTEYLADSLGVTAVLAQYSRLVVDCNRDLMDPTAFLPYGDGIQVPGNAHLRQAQKDARAEAIYWPYHAAIEAEIERLLALGRKPALVSIHSFTPVLNGEVRPWEIGVLWDKDESLRRALLRGFRAEGFQVGDNEPYSGKAPADYTVDQHAETRGLPCAGIEIRQDLVRDAAGVARLGNILHRIIDDIASNIVQGNERRSA